MSKMLVFKLAIEDVNVLLSLLKRMGIVESAIQTCTDRSLKRKPYLGLAEKGVVTDVDVLVRAHALGNTANVGFRVGSDAAVYIDDYDDPVWGHKVTQKIIHGAQRTVTSLRARFSSLFPQYYSAISAIEALELEGYEEITTELNEKNQIRILAS